MSIVDYSDSALGMIETRGLVAAIEAADAMVKTSEVFIVSVEQTIAALITIHVFGETAAVQAAVDAGRAAAQRVGEVLSSHVIPRPDAEVRSLVLQEAGVLGRGTSESGTGRSGASTAGASHQRSQETAGESRGEPGPGSTDLESMTVQELRRLARSIPELPIQGREIARANKQTLLELLRRHRP